MFRCLVGPRLMGIPKPSQIQLKSFVHFPSSKPLLQIQNIQIYSPTIRTFHVNAPLLRFIGSKTKKRRTVTRISPGVYQSQYFKPGPTSPYYALTQIDPRFWEDYFRQQELSEQQAQFEAEQKAAVSTRFADKEALLKALGMETTKPTFRTPKKLSKDDQKNADKKKKEFLKKMREKQEKIAARKSKRK